MGERAVNVVCSTDRYPCRLAAKSRGWRLATPLPLQARREETFEPRRDPNRGVVAPAVPTPELRWMSDDLQHDSRRPDSPVRYYCASMHEYVIRIRVRVTNTCLSEAGAAGTSLAGKSRSIRLASPSTFLKESR